ncbi:MAG: type II toxin-antitoxin system RelE/ParE family toxin [Planctomycetales bacterium]
MATVEITTTAQEQFHRLPKSIRARIERVFVRLEGWPNVSGIVALSGALAGHNRIRTGDYRIQFRIVPGNAETIPALLERVVIEKVGHRDGFYED